MKLLHAFVSISLPLIALSACDSKSSSSNQPASTPSAASSPSAVSPADDHPKTVSGTGPGEGGTAIGGMVGGQDKSGATAGDAPATTGGDGSAHAGSSPK
jgi:translation initiation factor IF-2